MEQKEFLDRIRDCRRRLNLAEFLHKLVAALGIGAVFGILFQIASLMVPLYYVNYYMAAVLALAALSAVAVAYMKQSRMEDAALVMDGFGFEERIVTAYENLKSEGDMYALQRADAMQCLKANQDKIHIRLMPPKKYIFLTTGLLAVMAGLVFVPSPVRQQAKELHEIGMEAKGKEEEIEEVLEELQEMETQELTPEQIAAFQEMMQSLQSSMAEYKQASSMEALSAAGVKLNYKYESMSEQLASLAQSMQGGAAEANAGTQAMQAMADKLQQMSGSPSGSQMASNSNGNQNGNGQNGNGQNGNSQSGNGQNGNSQNGNGQNGNSQNSQNGQNGQNGNGQNGNGQNGNGQSGNGQNGNGQSGNGQNGNGDGGNGDGRGTGSAHIARDYVSVPNAIADAGSLAGNAAGHDNSEYFRAPNGMSWEGTRISYQTVIGSYEQNAYEGIATGRYPSGMEDVIKDYFASFNQ